MVNQSKINDPRFWAVWRASGAVGDYHAAEKRKYISGFRHYQEVLGNLAMPEIEELEKFEFHVGASTIEEQVRRYYLKVKSEKPDKAAQMLEEVNPILKKGVSDLPDVEKLCRTLYNHISGFVIIHDGGIYSMHNNQFQTIHSPS